ncbi:asparagine synthase-related protein [Vibrio breoganii]
MFKVYCVVSNGISEYESLAELNNSNIEIEVSNINGDYSFRSVDIENRFFCAMINNTLYISDKLAWLSEKFILTHNKKAIDFYDKFGFIVPPYTQYSDVFILTPLVLFTVSNHKLTWKDLPPVKNEHSAPEVKLESIFDKYFSVDKSKNRKLDILVSGGIDSSALLGYLSQNNMAASAHMLKMSSLPGENNSANAMCNEISLHLNLVDLDKDLSSSADYLLSHTGELISDPIAIPLSDFFISMKENSSKETLIIVDGQGADSLLNGLPANKVFEAWKKVRFFRYLLAPLSYIPIYTNKTSLLKRKIYRFTKAMKSITQLDFACALIVILTENDELDCDLEFELLGRLRKLNKAYDDWHMTIRVFYMYLVLPAREMQKYSLAKSENIIIRAPFLSRDVVEELIFSDNNKLIKDGFYKYPITKLAQEYWPGRFRTSSTSPFQVNYDLSGANAKNYSKSYFHIE